MAEDRRAFAPPRSSRKEFSRTPVAWGLSSRRTPASRLVVVDQPVDSQRSTGGSTRLRFRSRQSQKFIHGHFRSQDAYHLALAVEDCIDSRPRKGMKIHLRIRIKEPGSVWRGICF